MTGKLLGHTQAQAKARHAPTSPATPSGPPPPSLATASSGVWKPPNDGGHRARSGDPGEPPPLPHAHRQDKGAAASLSANGTISAPS